MRNKKMIFTMSVLILFFVFTGYLQAKTPQESLNQYVANLQKNPNDHALREKIISYVRTMKPPPAIPAEAKRPFIKGVTFQKDATSSSDFELAIKSYKEALLLAPWWPDAIYNLALAQESAGKYDDAMKNLKLYLLTKPKDAEAAETKLYSLEAKKEKAAKDTAKTIEKKAKKQEVFIKDLAGSWFVTWEQSVANMSAADREEFLGRDYYQMSITGKNEFALKWERQVGGRGGKMMPYSVTYSGTVSGTKINGNYYCRQGSKPWNCGIIDYSAPFDGTISEDGRKIRVTYRGMINYDMNTCSKKYAEWTREFAKE
jgi:hypothetical protein